MTKVFSDGGSSTSTPRSRHNVSVNDENDASKSNLLGEDAMDFLHVSPQDLPQFGLFKWFVSAAILINNASSSTTERYVYIPPGKRGRVNGADGGVASRALLLLKKDNKWGNYELLQAEVQAADKTVLDALSRAIAEKSGLQLKTVLGSHTPVIVLDAWQPVTVMLYYAVTVEESSTLKSHVSIPVKPANGYTDMCWVSSKEAICEIQRIAPMHRLIIHSALRFRAEMWHNTSEYLDKTSTALEYQDRYEFIMCAAIVRNGRIKDSREQPAIFLIQCSSENEHAPSHWELPGCNIARGSTGSTLRAMLQNGVYEQTGICVSRIVGYARKKPLIKTSILGLDHPGMVILIYIVEADQSDEVKLSEDHTTWRWLDSEDEVFKLQRSGLMSKLDLKIVRLALQAAKTCTG